MTAAPERARALRALHRPGSPLLVPNAWDAESARLVVRAGFPVVATTSSGVAASLGFADRQGTPADEMFDAVRRIASAVPVPVTADVEGGYRLDPQTLADRLLATGAVGLNLEDSDHDHPGTLVDSAAQADRIARVKRAAAAAGTDVVLNARVDVFLRPGSLDEQVAETVRRARAYLDAGADCVFPILVTDEGAIARLVGEIPGPVNIMLTAATPPPGRLAELGVARISLGGGLHRSAMSAAQAALDRLRSGSRP